MIQDCLQESIQPCSVDLRLGKLFKTRIKGIIDFDSRMPRVEELILPYVIKPGEFVIGVTIERMDQRHTRYAALAIPRSRAFRVGLQVMCGLTHPHYKGAMVFGIKNISEHQIRLKKGSSIIQLAFFDVKSDCVPLNHRYQDGRII